jgi:hypothetical protein
MDYSVIIISLVTLGVFIAPPIYFSYRQKKKRKTFYKRIQDLAIEKSCSISESDYWKNSCIGYDNKRHYIFYANKESQMAIDLKDVLKCELKGLVPEKHQNIDKIELIFKYKDQTKPDSIVTFFNSETYYSVSEEDIKLAEKWKRLIASDGAYSSKQAAKQAYS